MADLERNIKYTIDPATQKVIDTLKELTKQEAKVAQEAIDSGEAFDKTAKKIKAINKEQRELQTVLRAVGVDFGKQESQVNDATRALDAYEDRLRSVQQGGADLSGDFASSFGGLRGAGDALTGGNFGAAGGLFEIGEAFADLGEFAPRLKAQISTLGDTMREGEGKANKLVAGLGDGIAGITGMSAGTASFAAVALPLVVVLGAAAVALDQFKKGMEAQRIQVAAAADALVDTNRAIAEGLTSDEAEAEIERLQALRAAEAQSVSDLEAAYEGIQEGLNDRLGGIVGEVVGAGVRAFDSREQQIVDTIRESQSTITSYDAEIRRLTEALETGELSANDTVQAEEELAEAREQQSLEIERLTAQYEQSANRAVQFRNQIVDIIEDTAQREADAAELAAVQAEIDQENERAELHEHGEKLEAIRAEGKARLEQIEAEIVNLDVERREKLADIASKGNEKLADLQQDYQKRTQDSYQDFTTRLSRATSDAAKNIRRLVEDINQSLDDATRANDVESFLKAQRDGETKLRRAQEDASDSQARQIEDFVKGREKEREAFEEKQRAIQAGIRREKQEAIQAFDERRQALQEQRQLERQAIEERIAQERASFQEQLRRDAIREEQQARLQAVRDAQQQAAHQRRIQEIQAQATAASQAAQAQLDAIARIQQAASGINAPRQQSSPVSNFLNNNPFARAATNVFQSAFQNNVTVGDVASTAQVNQALEENNRNIFGALGNIFQQARNGNR